jgi:hypothetical protein
MNGNRLIVRLYINELCILDFCEPLERVYNLLDQEIIDRIRDLENRFDGVAKKALLTMSKTQDDT